MKKTYTMSFADSINHVPANPERTAILKTSGFDVTFVVFPSTAALEKELAKDENNSYTTPRYRKWLPRKKAGLDSLGAK